MALAYLFIIYGLIKIAFSTHSDSVLPIKSSSPDISLICSPTDSTDCYPLTFQPTTYFQKIREGQNIPPGLHVRLNIYTGEKEARLNFPASGETGIRDDLNTLSKENAIIVVEQPKEKNDIDQNSSQDDSSIKHYLSESKILQPASNDEIQTFQWALNTIKLKNSLFDQALDVLLELSHDIYFGRELIHDDSILEVLMCLILGIEPMNLNVTEKIRERKAASIINSAFQNNAAALQEGSKNKNSIMYPSCIAHEKDLLSGERSFVSAFWSQLSQENDAPTLKTKVSAISRFLKNDDLRDIFIESKGMELLLEIFTRKGEKFDEVRKKVGELLIENFLDEALGAKTNIWPRTQRMSNTICNNEKIIQEDECWKYHIELFAAQAPTENWPKEILLAIKENRLANLQKSEL